ncbi:MAG: hypothetical protein C0490_23800, partial [Marivirga sp.]|nr:hypothetical protein [Marivirga sp.]
MRTDKIIIRGERQTSSDVNGSDFLQLDSSYIIRSSTRGISEKHEIKLTDNSIVEFVFEDGTTWFCSPNTIDEVFPEQTVASRSANEALEIPMVLIGTDVERGLIGNILLKVVRIFTKKKLTMAVKDLASDLEMKQLENQVGLFRLDRSFKLQKFTRETSSQPYLLFLHGTATSTKGSFGGLEGTEQWNFIHQSYEDRVLTFQHESLTKGPFQNVLDLISALPKSCSLHIISQSHGGLVGELLCRFCNSDENNIGFSEDEINLLKKSKRDEDVRVIGLIRNAVAGKRIKIEKFIRVACPAGGSTLASRRLDHLLNVIFNLISFGAGPVGGVIFSAFKNL